MTILSRLIIIVTVLFCGPYCFAQGTLLAATNGGESFSELQDTIIKKEVALFTVKGASMRKDPLSDPQVTEIPISLCTDAAIHFSKGSTFIHVYTKQQAQNRILDSIFVVIKSHLWVRIPAHTFEGVDELHSCDFSGNHKGDGYFSPFFKAFQSRDRLRFYIYMQGGTAANKYEVTWIIDHSKFYRRVVDSIP
jgi:hypothetical protein